MSRELRSLLNSNPYINNHNTNKKKVQLVKNPIPVSDVNEVTYVNYINYINETDQTHNIDNVDEEIPSKTGVPTPRTKLSAKILMNISKLGSSSNKINKKKISNNNQEYIKKANEIRNKIKTAFKKYMIESGKNKSKTSALNIPGITDTIGVYKFSEKDDNDTFKFTLDL